jgi:hypothetical protein
MSKQDYAGWPYCPTFPSYHTANVVQTALSAGLMKTAVAEATQHRGLYRQWRGDAIAPAQRGIRPGVQLTPQQRATLLQQLKGQGG